MHAELPRYNAAGMPVKLRLGAGQDVGKFVARAIGLPQWHPVLTMSGERFTTRLSRTSGKRNPSLSAVARRPEST